MLKKQVNALNKILEKERYRYKDKEGLGIHPSHDKYVATNGYMFVVFDTQPEGYILGDRIDNLVDTFNDMVENGNLNCVCESQIYAWNGRNFHGIIMECRNENGLIGCFDKSLYDVAAAACGRKHTTYIGTSKRWNGNAVMVLIGSGVNALILPFNKPPERFVQH